MQTHGAPGLVQWGNGLINGKDLSKHLEEGGFKGKGAKIDVFACNSATPAKGGGTSVAQVVANKGGSSESSRRNAP